MLIVDEVHEFKKPPLSTKMKVKGLNTTASGRSIGLNFLTSYVKEQNNGKGVHTFTGTPITNTLNEIYNHMRYVMSNEMEKADVLSWDSWFNTFASVESDIERTSSGDYEMVSRLSGFHNVSELRKFAGQYMDIVFAEDMPEFVPRKTKNGKDLHSKDLTDAERDELVNGRVDKGNPSGRPYKKLVNEVADMSEEQRGILQTLVDRAKSFKDASGKERRDIMKSGDPRNPVIIETDAAKAGFDPRLYDKELSDHPRNKINRCVTNVLKHYQEHEKASQVIFMDKGYNDQATRSRSDGAGGKAKFKVDTFNASKDLKNKLIEGGIPAEQIAIVNSSVAKKKRLEIANKVNSGEIRVVIGLTSTLGTGTNMQENLRAMHHLDAPWMPGELEQRNGRGHRQGNRWNTVLEYRYITESIDARRWQVLAKKQKMITDFLKAKEGVRSIEGDAVDLVSKDLDEINSSFSEAAGDARILIREKLKKDIDKLEKKERTHGQGVVDAKNKIKDIEGRRLPNLKDRVKGLQSDMSHYQSVSKEPWSITIDGKKYTKRQKANVAFEKLSLKLSAQGLRLTEKKNIGTYRGFDIMVSGSVGQGNTYTLERDLSYPIKPATGSIDFLTRNFPSMLDNARKQVSEETNALDKFKQVVKEPFAQEEALKNKKESLDQLEQDLESNPDAPPSWLAQGAPVGTEVYYKGEPWEVDGHRKGEHGHYLIVKQGENQEVVDYREVMDENNMPVYEALEGDVADGVKIPTTSNDKRNTDSKEFKKWFKNSEIVDEEGKPLVVYHATIYPFTVFDKNRNMENDTPTGMFSFAFTSKFAEEFGTRVAMRQKDGVFQDGDRMIAPGLHVKPVYIRAENIFKPHELADSGEIDTVTEFLRKTGRIKSKEDFNKSIKETPNAWGGDYNNYLDIETERALNARHEYLFFENPVALKALGYDGVLFKEDGQEVLSVLEPTQIKSIYNTGTWDGSNPDIRYQTSDDKQNADTKTLDKKYFDAIQRGDMEAAQQLVNEAAEKSGAPIFEKTNETGFSIRRTSPPKKTVKVYKAFRMRDGKLYPMFVGAKDELPINQWMDATEGGYHFTADNGREYIPADTGVSIKIPNDEVRQELFKRGYIKKPTTKSIKSVAYRPGWHGGEVPFFPQAGNAVFNNKKKKLVPEVPDGYSYPNVHEFDTVIAEVEMDADYNYKQEYLDSAARNKDGSINKTLSGLRRIPKGGYYEYATNPLFKDRPELGKWYISGSVKINKILSQKEVNKRLAKIDVPQQLWNKSKDTEFNVLDLNRLGYDPQFNHLHHKLLDPVTYDDNGNPIPLSKRFDLTKTDPRYSSASTIDKAPGQGITLDQIKSKYKNQQITTNPDGILSIRFTNGKGVRIKTVDHIGGDDIRFAMESGRMKRDGVILGKYQDGEITLNTNMADMETAIHENYHALKALGMITPADEKTLNNLTKMLKAQKKNRYDIQEDMEENQANTLAQLVADRANYREGSNVNALIQKIVDFFDALVHIGRQSARKLAREYESGDIYGREANGLSKGTPNFQTAGNTDSEAFKKWFDGSVAKTKSGEPVSFFHGSPNRFTVFEDRPGESTTHTASGLGHFFTMDRDYANSYAKDSGNVIEAYLQMKKPYKMSLDEAQSFETVTDSIIKKRKLRLRGYDSIIIPVPGASPLISVFSSGQVKSVANRGTWDGSNPDIRYQTSDDAKAPTESEKKKVYGQIASGLQHVIKNRKNKGPGYKKDIGVLENTMGLMSHYSESIPALKRTFEELLKRPEWKFQKENELSKNGEESMIGTMEDLQKHNKAAYSDLKEYLVDRDINQIGAVLIQDEDGTWTIKSPKDERTGKRSILEEGILTKNKARDLAIQYEVDEYPDPAARDALRAFRTVTANLHDFYAESWESIIEEYEERGLTLPEVVTRTEAGENRINLKVALSKMGERSSYYFPRQRSNGDWRVYAEKEGEHPFIEYRDFKSTADYLAGKMESQGYTVQVEKTGSMSEDVYQNVKSILSTQAMVNQALSETKLDTKLRTLKDLGINGEWRGEDYVLPAGGVYEWSESVLKKLGGQPYSDLGRGGNSWSPGYRFDNAPKDMPDIVTNALFQAQGQDADVSFEIAKSLANQLADDLRARGSRARMISRSDATGKDVPMGYETDPLKALAQAVNSAAGGYAKQQVAVNTSKAITGQHYTWNEWQKQHPDYDALQAVEESLKTMQKNSKTENERIDAIDQKIKELQRERVGVNTESEAARQDRLFRIGTLFREKEKIRKWKNDDQAAAAHQELARLRGKIHKEYRQYIQDNMLDPKRQKRAYTDAVNAVENVLKNDEAADRVISTLKGLASAWFLGGRLSSAAINLTAMGTTVPAAMDAYGGVPLRKTATHIAKAGKSYASFVTGKGTVPNADRAILEEIFSRGWVAAQLNMETVNALKSGPAQKYGRAVELLMTPFKITEEFNRGTTLLAAYKGIMSENPSMSKEDALSKAKTVSDRAHGIYGVENQPALLRKGRGLRAASAMYIFQTFMHNYMTTLSYMIGRRQAAASTYMILSPMIFGGAASSLALPVVQMIFRAMGEDDPEEKIYQVAEDMFGESGGDIARYGLPGLAGVSLKGSLAPGLPDFKEPLDVLGPIGGMMRNIYQGGVNITQGNYLKGVEKITPLAMGNIAKAYRETSEGITTRAGDQVFFGNEQVQGDLGTGIMRAAGLNPTKIAKPREIQWNETKLKRQYAEKKRRIYSRIVRYHAQPVSKKNPDEWQDIVIEVKKFNARVKSNELTDIVPRITRQTIKSRIRRAFRPSKRERTRE
jgi:hypothetical protein